MQVLPGGGLGCFFLSEGEVEWYRGCCLRRDLYPPSHGASHKISQQDWRPAVSSGYSSSQIFCIAVSSSGSVCAASDPGQFMEWLCVFDIPHNKLSN